MLDSSTDCAVAIEALQVLSTSGTWKSLSQGKKKKVLNHLSDDGKFRIISANILSAIVNALSHAAMRKHASYLLAGLAEYSKPTIAGSPYFKALMIVRTGGSQTDQIVALQAVPRLMQILRDPTCPRRSALVAIRSLASNGTYICMLQLV